MQHLILHNNQARVLLHRKTTRTELGVITRKVINEIKLQPGPVALLCHTYCRLWNGLNWIEIKGLPSPEFTPCGPEKLCSFDNKCVFALYYKRKSTA